MKKMVGSLVMTSAMLLGTVAPMVTIVADTTPSTTSSTTTSATTPAAENRSGSTSTDATFTANTSAMNPVDPKSPNTTTTDPGNNAGKPGGGLSLIYAPMTLDFGTHEINVINNQSYNAKGETATGAGGAINVFSTDPTGKASWSTGTTTTTNQTTLYPGTTDVVLEVADVRGTNAGWTLNVSGTSGAASAINGATITLPEGVVTSSGAINANGSGTAEAPNGAISTGRTITVDGATVSVLSAAATHGAGISTDSLNPADITLNVNANAASKGTFTGALNWTLSDTALTNNK